MNYLKLFRESKTLDIFDLNFNLSSEKIGLIYSRKIKAGILGGTIKFISGFFYSLFKYVFGKKNKIKLSEILVLYGSRNQRDSLLPIRENIRKTTTIGFHNYGEDFTFNIAMAYLLSFPFYFKMLKTYFSAQGYRKESLNYYFNWYWLTYGFYVYANKFLSNKTFKVLVLANDHTMRPRVLNLVAKKKMIKTIYIQHASVNENFPPLNFDYACLDGIEALKKYDTIGKSNTKVFVTGSVKLDNYLINFDKKLTNTIGICSNPLDNPQEVIELAVLLKNKFKNYKIIVRPHPNDKNIRYYIENIEKNSLDKSEANSESVYSFLETVSIIVAGESNIHLEAVALNVPSIYYKMGDYKIYDWYGFIEKGIIKYCPNNYTELIADIKKNLENHQDINENAENFFYNLKNGNQGNSIALINAVIQHSLDKERKLDMAKITFVKNINAYYLNI